MGIAAEEIPRGPDRTPDLLVNDDTECPFLIEVKTRRDDPKYLKEISGELASGGVVGRSKPINYCDAIDKMLSDGAKQIKLNDPHNSQFHVIWFHCDGFDADRYQIQTEATIYGIEKLVSEQVGPLITCYYFGESSFFTLRSFLDGVVVSKEGKAQFFLNNHSPRFEKVLTSPLSVAFGKGVFYPSMNEGITGFMINDSTCYRGDERANLDYLRKKYSVEHLQVMPMGFHRAMIRPSANKREVDTTSHVDERNPGQS